MAGTGQRVPAWQLAAVGALYGFGALAVLGYATFGLHPGWLAQVPGAPAVYAVAFEFFARAQVWLAGGVLALLLVRYARLAWVPALVLVYALSLGSELAGTTWGIPFGAYAYTELLGARWLERVPVVIPLSWFTMALPSYAFALWQFPADRAAARVLLGSLLLLVWDLSLDPAMSYATPYWQWGAAGPYYGMPLLNLFGWYVTGVVLMLVFVVLRAERWLERVPTSLLAWYYGANLLVPIGMCVAAGLWGAVVLSGAMLIGILVFARRRAPARVLAFAEARP